MQRNILAAALLVIAAGTGAVGQELRVPESMAHDAERERYLVSNYGGESIVSVDGEGVVRYFARGLDEPLGLIIEGDRLYNVESGGRVRG